MSLQRSTVLQALFNLVSASAAYETASRRLVPWTEKVSQPAIFQRFVGEETQPLEGFGQPQLKTLHVEIWIYAKQQGPDSYPEDVFTPLLDALDTALAANTQFDGRQDLGMPDVVHHVWRQGEATYSSGEMGDQIVCHVPLRVLVVGNFSSP